MTQDKDVARGIVGNYFPEAISDTEDWKLIDDIVAALKSTREEEREECSKMALMIGTTYASNGSQRTDPLAEKIAQAIRNDNKGVKC